MHDGTPGPGRDGALADAVDAVALVGATRSRARASIPAPDRRSGLITGGSLAAVVAAWLLLAPPTGASPAVFVACVLAHAAASSIEFEIGPGCALPTTPVLVVTLFLLPPPLVPVVAASGLLLAAGVAALRDPSRHERLAVLVGSAWHAVGPAAVFALFGVSGPNLADLPVYALALAAQLACDACSTWVRNGYGLGVPVRSLADALRFTFSVDVLLWPVGLSTALAMPHSAASLLLLVPPVALLAILQQDRQRNISRALVLGAAVSEAADQARLDALTGLRNRLAWEEALAAHRRAVAPLGVVFADVDGLKTANDVLGHETGDRLLATVADLVRRATPVEEAVLAARLGGDEFGILLPGDAATLAEGVAGALRSALRATPAIDGRIPVSASIGVGYAASGGDVSRALAEADRLLYEEKNAKHSRRGEPITHR
jgi:diguanylate cyclase (GGDEF)-like protein